MVNSGSFDSDVDRNEKDGFTQHNHVVETPQSVVSIHAVSGSLCENDFTTQTADSLPVSQAIEPTATKTEFKCNMSEEFIRVSENLKPQSNVEGTRDCMRETTHVVNQCNKTEIKHSFISDVQHVDRYINMGYLRKYKIERKPSICCSVPLDRIPNVLKTCSSLIANKTFITNFETKKEIQKKDMCLYCDRTFLIPTMKQKHMTRFHSTKLSKYRNLRKYLTKCWYCDVNKETEHDLKELFSHLVTEHPEKYFGCLECETRFPTSQALENHKTSTHNNVSPLRLSKQITNTSKKGEKTGTQEHTTKITSTNSNTEAVKTKPENKRNGKANNQNSISNLDSDKISIKTRRKCQSKYLNDDPKNDDLNSQLPDSAKSESRTRDDNSRTNGRIKQKTKLVKELRNKKLSVISTKVGMKHCLRITRQRSKILENAKNSKKRIQQTTQKPETTATTKYIRYPNNYSPFDISYRVKKITDHSIDNLRISSLTFDDVFDKAFFNRVKCNIQENLLNHVDGKLFKSVESENRISSFQKKEDLSTEDANSSCGYNAITSTPIVLIDSNVIEDSESLTDSGAKSAKKKNAIVDEAAPCKYFTRRKYQAVISERKGNKDLSKLDIWTQLVMKNRQQKIISEQKSDKEKVEYKKSDEYKAKMQLEELNGILDKRGPLEDLKEEAMRTVALEKLSSATPENDMDTYLDVTIILNDILNNLFPKDTSINLPQNEKVYQQINSDKIPQTEEVLSMFNLQRISHTSRVNAIENVLGNELTKTAIVELTGEWARTRIYVCAACGLKLPNAKLLVDHKNLFHANVWCQHYELVGNQGELYRHLSIPGLGKIGAIEDKLENSIWRRSDARLCSKCNKRFNCLGDLHRHILECGGDLAWMLERKKYKYRPYGSKTRKKRRGLLRLLRSVRNQTREKRKKTIIKKFNGPRQKPSDADTIQRMLANLPAKRTTRKVISLKDGFPRSLINKKLINTNKKPSRTETQTIVKQSVKNTTKGSNKNRTRRLLRSNSSLLLENNLILPKFKRKKNETSSIIRRRSLRTNTNAIKKKILTKNAIVTTLKLTEEQIKSLMNNELQSTKAVTDNTSSSDDEGILQHKEDEKVHEDEDQQLQEDTNQNTEILVDAEDKEKSEEPVQLNGKLSTLNPKEYITKLPISEEVTNEQISVVKSPIRRRKKKRKTKSKLENNDIKIAENTTKKKRNRKKAESQNYPITLNVNAHNIRKLRVRNPKNLHKVTIQDTIPKINKRKKRLVKNNLTEIVQVDGSPQSKPLVKTKKESTVCNQVVMLNVGEVSPESSRMPEEDDIVLTNQLNLEQTDIKLNETLEEPVKPNEDINVCTSDKQPEDNLTVASSVLPTSEPPAIDFDNDPPIRIPQVSRRSTKKLRGLNDCIAMLTNKLQDKHLNSNGSNALENFCNKNDTSNEIVANKIEDDRPEVILNLQIDEKKVETVDSINIESSCDFNINGNNLNADIESKPPSPLSDAIIPTNNKVEDEPVETSVDDKYKENDEIVTLDTTRTVLTETAIYDDFSFVVDKPKTKHKRRKTRKKQILQSNSDKLKSSNDKLQEIHAENKDVFNGTKDFKLNSKVENPLNIEKENGSNDSDKFSNSEKENTFNNHPHKISKTRKVKRKIEKIVQMDTTTKPTQALEAAVINNHIMDIINAVARNETADSDDELPLSQLMKKYVIHSAQSVPPTDETPTPNISTNEENELPTEVIVTGDKHINQTIVDNDKETPADFSLDENEPLINIKIVKTKRSYSKRRKRKNGENWINDKNVSSTDNVEKILPLTVVDTMENTAEPQDNPIVTENTIEAHERPIVTENVHFESIIKEGETSAETTELSPKEIITEKPEIEGEDIRVMNDSLCNEAEEECTNAISKLSTPIKSRLSFKRKSRKLIQGNKTSPRLANKSNDDTVNSEDVYCDICNKTFRRSENLLKHKRTLTHIAKLSEIEARESVNKSESQDKEIIPTEKFDGIENSETEERDSFQTIESVPCEEYEQTDVSRAFSLGSPQESLQLVDIIDDVLSKPIDTEYSEHRNFSNLVLQSDNEVKRCKSLGERKSFDCDKLNMVDNISTPIQIEDNFEVDKIRKTTADVIVEKQISLLENMIEDNRNTFKTTDKIFTTAKVPIAEEYSCQSNSSTFSMLSSNKQEELNEITFTHNTNIIAKLIKPSLEDHLIPSAHYEQISDDSNSSHFPIEEQKSRKVLNRDEELFLECCSLLKSSSDVSDLCRKSVKSTKFLNNFGLKPLDELEWMEQKQLPITNTILNHSTTNTLNLTHANTPVCDTFYSDVTFSNAENSNSKMFLEKTENTNFFSQAPIFEDISTESDDSSRKSMTHSKSVAVASIENNNFTIKLNEDRLSPNVECAQIPCEENKHVEIESEDEKGEEIVIKEIEVNKSIENDKDIQDCADFEEIKDIEDCVDIEESKDIEDTGNDEGSKYVEDTVDVEDIKSVNEAENFIKPDDQDFAPASPASITKTDGVKTIQSNITDYVVSKKVKKQENKKLVTKGALKVFEGLKVSIPKDELDMKEVLSCSPTSKRLEIEAEQDKIAEKKCHKKKDFINRNFVLNRIIKDSKKLNNKLGLKATKKRYNVDGTKNLIKSKMAKMGETDKKCHDIYDFEETQDSVDIFIKNSDSLPDYHSFKNKITSKTCITDEFDIPLTKMCKSKDDAKKTKHNLDERNVSDNSVILSSRKLKMNKSITKKKCMIMGRIFKNALKSKVADEIKNIPAIDNSRIVESFVMNCQNLQTNKHEKHKLSEEEMNLLFDSLLHDDHSINSENKEKNRNDITEIEPNVMHAKNNDVKCRQKQNNKLKRRQRANSSDSSDEEFSIKKASKKQINRKPNSNDCVINLEQELKECIGVASRKSQRKCTSGKQNVLVEYWSSDESNFGYEKTTVVESANSVSKIVEESVATSNSITEVINNVVCGDGEITDISSPPDNLSTEQEDEKSKEMKKRCFKTKHFKKKKIVHPENRDNEGDPHNEENDSETIASTRQKRNAVDTLYYWSSSSEDEMQDIIEVKPIRDDCEEEDRPLQQGWIVGDSPKKLVTMLAQAKGKKLDVEYVKKNRKKRTTV